MSVTPYQQSLIQMLNQAESTYKTNPSLNNAIECIQLKIKLSTESQTLTEKKFFLNHALTFGEFTLLQTEYTADNPEDISTYLTLVSTVAQIYLSIYLLEKKSHFIKIAEQIIKPHAHHSHQKVLETIVTLYDLSNRPALKQHWNKKLTLLKEKQLHNTYFSQQKH